MTISTPDFIAVSEAFAKGDLAAAEPHFAHDIRWNILGSEPVIGRQDVLDVSKMAQLESFPEITIGNVVAEGNFVVIESTGKATTKAGMPYHQRYCDVFRFEDGKLREITTYLDTALSNAVSGNGSAQ